MATLLADERKAHADAVLERRGNGFALEILLLAGFGWVSDGAEGVVMSYMMPALEDVWHISHAEQGALGSIVFFGMTVGSCFWGALADAIGRRPCFLLSLASTVGLGGASCLAPNFYTYCALRLGTGFAIGGNLPLAVSVASELLPPSSRERGIVALQLFNEIGSLASTGLAAMLLPWRWRMYLVAVAIPAAIVFCVALFRLPESPHWLIAQGRYDEASELLARIDDGQTGVKMTHCRRGGGRHDAHHTGEQVSNGLPDDPQQATTGTRTEPDDDERASNSLPPVRTGDSYGTFIPRFKRVGHRAAQCCGGLLPLFGRQLLPTTIFLCILWFSANFASGWWSWLPEFAKLQGVPQAAMYTSVTAARVVAMGAFILAAAVIGRLGAYRLLLAALVGTTALSGVLSVAIDDPNALASDAFVALYCGFALVFGITWPVMYVVTPSAFPPSHRAFGFGFVSAFSKLGGLTQPLVVAAMLPQEDTPSATPMAPPLLPPTTLPSPPPLPMPPALPAVPPPPAAHALFAIGSDVSPE